MRLRDPELDDSLELSDDPLLEEESELEHELDEL